MKAAVIYTDVDVEDVAIFERSVIRNSVADNFVYARADGFGKMAVVQG